MVPVDSDRIPRVPPYLGFPCVVIQLHVRDFHALRCAFPGSFLFFGIVCPRVLQPRSCQKQQRFRLFSFRSPLLRESIFLSFPAGTKMFQFPASAPSCDGTRPSAWWVVPFGVRRINSCLLIPGDFRSLPRPSSLPEAKASPIRPS